MKGYKKNGKFIPTESRKKKALKKSDIPKKNRTVNDDTIIEERAEWAWIHRGK